MCDGLRRMPSDDVAGHAARILASPEALDRIGGRIRAGREPVLSAICEWFASWYAQRSVGGAVLVLSHVPDLLSGFGQCRFSSPPIESLWLTVYNQSAEAPRLLDIPDIALPSVFHVPRAAHSASLTEVRALPRCPKRRRS